MTQARTCSRYRHTSGTRQQPKDILRQPRCSTHQAGTADTLFLSVSVVEAAVICPVRRRESVEPVLILPRACVEGLGP